MPTLIAMHIQAQGHPGPAEPASKSLEFVVCYGSAILDTTYPRHILVEKLAFFPGCDDVVGSNDEKYHCSQERLLDYVKSNLQYPNAAKSAALEGLVVVQFTIELDGTVTGVKCIKDLGMGCCEEAVRVITSMNHLSKKWTPAERLRKPIRMQMYVPVEFKL